MELSLRNVATHVIYGRDVLVKRDDLVTFGPRINGNKYRKLLHIVKDTAGEPIVSFGPYQSNSMAALASVCKMQGRKFVYYSLPVPPDELRTPVANLKFALEAGMELRQVEREGNPLFLYDLTADEVTDLSSFHMVPLSVAYKQAEEGCRQLARELVEQLEEYSFTKVKVACSSYSGALAMFIERYFRERAPHISAVAVPCSGDGTRTREEMEALDKKTGNLEMIPEVLYRKRGWFLTAAPIDEGVFKRYRMEEKLHVREELMHQGLPVDFLFGAGAWEVMKTRTDFFKDNGFALVYYHYWR
ncbi:hypothetical protein NDN08_001631 [Rhodosorus marinus]|uniref:Tryptophan synthase beta chain-like PALP domain-containing protein n=1 Tax=Rhodosorus marinus TaxID=101924 RepID=A0AAV8URE9_9RHOD|nr:hypothetical protein NDN08_001631 [Rhodosorus marinus]